MKIFVSNQEKKILLNAFKEYENNFDIFIFGSRARGDHKKYSDLDICLQSTVKIDPNIISKLKNIFEESSLPYTVDIIDWDEISKEFQTKIKKDLIPFI